MCECFRPFSAGTRRCIGQNMGYRVTRALLAKKAWKLDWELVNGDNFDWERDIRLYATYFRPEFRPATGCRMSLRRPLPRRGRNLSRFGRWMNRGIVVESAGRC